MKEKNYPDLALALENGLRQKYGGQFSVEVKNFKREHQGNPFSAIYPVSLIIYAKDGSLASNGPQKDLFASNGHDEHTAEVLIAQSNGHADNLQALGMATENGKVQEPWESEHAEAH